MFYFLEKSTLQNYTENYKDLRTDIPLCRILSDNYWFFSNLDNAKISIFLDEARFYKILKFTWKNIQEEVRNTKREAMRENQLYQI